MKRQILTTLAEILGIAAVCTGIAHRFGWDYATIVAGIVLVAVGVIQA